MKVIYDEVDAMKVLVYRTLVILGAISCVCSAAPEPAIVQGPGDWTLEVRFEHPQQIASVASGDREPSLFWYTIITLTNKTGGDVEFYPKCELMTDTFEIVPAGKGVSPAVIEGIKKRHRGRYPFLESIDEVGNRILQGSDNERDIVIVWPNFDSRANNIKLFLAGLSNETVVIDHPRQKDDKGKPVKVYLRKTLELSYDLPSGAVPRSQVKLTYKGKDWVMR